MSNNHSIPVVKKEFLIPFIAVTSLFALWGFANAITDPMVQAFKKVLELTNSQASMVQMAFYGGYFCMALPAALFVRKYSYKTGVIIGLALFSAGALLFYPAAITEKFWFFCLGLYILTFGLAFLETTANPYVLAMGDKETATQRLNLAQTFNPVGNITGLLIAKFFILKNLQSDDYGDDYAALDVAKKAVIRAEDLAVIRDPYVMLGLFLVAFLVIFFLIKMPQVRDEGKIPSLASIFGSLFSKTKYVLGVIAQILYVGAQIMCWTYIYQYAEAKGISSDTAANYQVAAFILFFVGRAFGTWLLRYINSGRLLMIFSVLAGILTILTIYSTGLAGMYYLLGISFFMSVMFPTIYGIALKDLSEEESKIGAAGLVMAIVGGALMPKLQGMIIDWGGVGVADTTVMGVSEINFSFVLPLACFVYVAWYGFHVYRKYSIY